MNPRKLFLFSAIILTAFMASVSAQQSMSPDQKAFNDANALIEPDKKVAALEKFVVDFPDGSARSRAYQIIYQTLIKNNPDQTARILAAATKYVETASESGRTSAYSAAATAFLDAGILLPEAEKFTGKGLALAEEEMAKSAQQRRATFQATLGRIYLKQGELDKAETSLKQASEANPQLVSAILGMAELYDKRGNSQLALNQYISAAVMSKLAISARQQLNALYAKTHNGSLAGLEDMLDAKYVELNPPPFKVDPYKPTPKRTNRVVLAEVFTGSGCPPCVAADLAADLAMERYARTELAVIMYHEHIPQPDPMTTAQNSARFKYYAGTGVPTVVIDGHETVGGGGREATKGVYDGFNREIEGRLEVAPEASLKIQALLNGTKVQTNVVVDKLTNDSPDIKLHIVLAEEKLRYTGENGVRFHPMVVRSMAGAENPGFPVSAKGPQTVTWDFDLTAISASIKKHLDDYEAAGHRGSAFTFTEKKYEIDPKDLVIVAFVQNEKTRAILQSVFIKVNH